MDWMMTEDCAHSRLTGGVGRCSESLIDDAYMEESSSSSSSSSSLLAHFDYTGTYRLTSVYNDVTMQTIQVDPSMTDSASFTFAPTKAYDEYDVIIGLNNRIQARIRIAPNDEDKIIQVSEGGSGNMSVPCQSNNTFDEIVSVQDLAVIPSQPGTPPKLLEVILTGVLSRCDMIRFVGDRLVLEGPAGAIECLIQDE